MMQVSSLTADDQAPAVLQLHPGDDVAVALRPIEAGEQVEVGGRVLTAAEPIPHGMVTIASGAPAAAERNGEREIPIWKRGVTL